MQKNVDDLGMTLKMTLWECFYHHQTYITVTYMYKLHLIVFYYLIK